MTTRANACASASRGCSIRRSGHERRRDAPSGPARRIVLHGQSTASVTTGAAMDFSIATPTNGPDLSPDCRYGIAGFLGPPVVPRDRNLVAGACSQCHYAHLSSYFVISSLTPAAA
jgi:hypothetical protein